VVAVGRGRTCLTMPFSLACCMLVCFEAISSFTSARRQKREGLSVSTHGFPARVLGSPWRLTFLQAAVPCQLLIQLWCRHGRLASINLRQAKGQKPGDLKNSGEPEWRTIRGRLVD
jgi:hypothetical protein